MKSLKMMVKYPWILPTVIFSILVLIGANLHPLWGDEAETALFARNILKFGVPKGWDGVNLMGLDNAVVLNKDLINHSSPWAQYYLTALSFKLFGESSFTARLPFILLAIFSLPVMYLLILYLTNNRKVAFLTNLALSLSVPLILFSYQARYYSIGIFAGACFVYSSLRLLEKRIFPKIAFVTSGIAFFHGNYIAFTGFYIATLLSVLVYNVVLKKSLKRFLLWYISLSILIGIFTLPWLFVLSPMESRGHLVIPTIQKLLSSFWQFFPDSYLIFNENNAFPLLFLPLLIIVLYRARKSKASLAPLVIATLLPIIDLLILTLFTIVSPSIIFVWARYTMAIFPFLVFGGVLLINEAWKRNKRIGFILFLLYVGSNIFTLNFSPHPPRSFLLEYFGEIIHPYPSPDKIVADYLLLHAHAGESAFVNIDRHHEPLIFFLGDSLRFVNRVSSTNSRIFPKNRRALPRYIYDFRGEVDWVILFSRRAPDGTFFTQDLRTLPPGIDLTNDYALAVLSVFFEDLSRPEMYMHTFGEIIPSYNDQVFVYRKKEMTHY